MCFLTADITISNSSVEIPEGDAQAMKVGWVSELEKSHFFLHWNRGSIIFSYSANIFLNYIFCPFLCGLFKEKQQHKLMTSNIKEEVRYIIICLHTHHITTIHRIFILTR